MPDSAAGTPAVAAAARRADLAGAQTLAAVDMLAASADRPAAEPDRPAAAAAGTVADRRAAAAAAAAAAAVETAGTHQQPAAVDCTLLHTPAAAAAAAAAGRGNRTDAAPGQHAEREGAALPAAVARTLAPALLAGSPRKFVADSAAAPAEEAEQPR